MDDLIYCRTSLRAIILGALLLGASAVGADEIKYGFRDLTFGSAPTRDMKFVDGDRTQKLFVRGSDKLTIGAGKLHKISYLFYKNKLATVLIEAKGITNSKAVLATLQAAYGQGNQPTPYDHNFYVWYGSKTKVVYNGNSITNDSDIAFFATDIEAEQEADKNRNAQEGAGDL